MANLVITWMVLAQSRSEAQGPDFLRSGMDNTVPSGKGLYCGGMKGMARERRTEIVACIYFYSSGILVNGGVDFNDFGIYASS